MGVKVFQTGSIEIPEIRAEEIDHDGLSHL